MIKTGTIIDLAGSRVPEGFLECDGRALSRLIYSGLFSVIGTSWGDGDGSSTFNLPNLSRTTTVGRRDSSDQVGQVVGEEAHALSDSEIVFHRHQLTQFNDAGNVTGGAVTLQRIDGHTHGSNYTLDSHDHHHELGEHHGVVTHNLLTQGNLFRKQVPRSWFHGRTNEVDTTGLHHRHTLSGAPGRRFSEGYRSFIFYDEIREAYSQYITGAYPRFFTDLSSFLAVVSQDHEHRVPPLTFQSAGSSEGHNNMQPSAVVIKAIKV